MSEELHVDLYHHHPLVGSAKFQRRIALDDPIMVTPSGHPTQVATGWATYVYVSEPHTVADCPHEDAP